VVSEAFDGAVASTGFAVLRTRSAVDRGYLWALVRSSDFLTHLTARQTGSNYPAVRPQDIADFEARWPDLSSRQLLGELVADAELASRASVTRARTNLALLKELIEAATAHAVARPLANAVVSIAGGRSPRCPDRRPLAGERGVLKTSSVRPYAFDWTEAKALDESSAFHESARVQQGDLLMLRASGNKHRVGEACVVEKDYPDLMLSDLIYKLKVDSGVATPEYLALALHVGNVRDQIVANSVGSSTMRKLNHTLVKQLQVPMLDMEAQHTLVATVTVVKDALRASSVLSHRLEVLVQALADLSADEAENWSFDPVGFDQAAAA
jgi:type I restriction enzyme S subunit